MGDALGRQRLREGSDGLVRAGHHAGIVGVDGGHRQRVGQALADLVGRLAHREHLAGRQGLDQPAASGDQAGGIGSRHHAGDDGGGEFAQAVADQQLGLDAQGLPVACQGIFEGKERGLGQAGLGQIGVAAVEDQGTQVAAQGQAIGRRGQGEGADRFGRFVEGGREGGRVPIQHAAHAAVLGALTRKQPGEPPRLARAAGEPVRAVGRGQRADRLVRRGGQHALPLVHRAAAVVQRERDIVQVGRMLAQVGRQLLALGGQGRVGAGAQRQEVEPFAVGITDRAFGSVGGLTAIGRRFLDDDVGVGAAHAEGADAGPTRHAFLDGPGRVLGGDAERALLQPQAGVRGLVMQGAGDQAVLERHDGLDGAGGAGGDDGVAEVALERAEHGKAGVGGFLAPGAGDGRDLDRITHRCGRAVGLDVLDAARRQAGIVEGGPDDGMLAVDAGGGEAGLVGAIVVDADPADHRVDGVSVAAGIGEPLEQHHGGSVRKDGALGVGIEASGAPVGREHRAGLVAVTAVDRGGDGDAAGQRHPALPGPQGRDGLGNGHQRGRAGGMDRDGRPLQVQPVGGAGGDVVLLVGQHHLELAQGGDLVRVVLKLALEIGGVVHAGEDADVALAITRGMAGVLQALPGQLQEDALLRIHQLGFARADAEEGGIEAGGIVEHAAGRHVIRVAGQRGRQRGVELLGPEMTDAVLAGDQVLPEFVDAGGAGKAPGHADDGDGTRVVAGGGGHGAGIGADVRAVSRREGLAAGRRGCSGRHDGTCGGGCRNPLGLRPGDAVGCRRRSVGPGGGRGRLRARSAHGSRGGRRVLPGHGGLPGKGARAVAAAIGPGQAAGDARGKGGGGRVAEEVLDADEFAETLVECIESLGRQQRGAADLEEVVVRMQAIDGEDRPENGDHLLLDQALIGFHLRKCGGFFTVGMYLLS